jgi:rubrerythrin
MTLEEAILTSLEHETNVRDYYSAAARVCSDRKGRAFFEMMAKDEQGHVEYLTAKLAEWRSEGAIKDEALATIVPSREWVAKGMERMVATGSKGDMKQESDRLYTALKMEEEVTQFYRGLATSVPGGEKMFRRFIEIEDGHTAVVQAEIDMVHKNGYFYDFLEFGQEG